ncbi:hypothetical protein [Wolbachia endosymbiont (group B) of Gerris lacustris]|uniref:hypothetical protein n=1 Tax=Wolbachia endosymbiont (group B) of Gerris lacustris TaxID=3066159 RepID=UPI00333FF817
MKIAIDGKTKVISAKEVKNRQKGIDLIYDKDYISAEEVHHIQLIKAGKKMK